MSALMTTVPGVGESGDLGLAGDPVEVEHVHVWEWLRSGRVPGEPGRFEQHVCACGEGRRVDR